MPRPYKLVLGLVLILPGLAGAGELGDKVTSFLQLEPVMEVQICDAEPLSNCKKAEDLDHMLNCLAKMREAMKAMDSNLISVDGNDRTTSLGVMKIVHIDSKVQSRWQQTMRECVQEGKP